MTYLVRFYTAGERTGSSKVIVATDEADALAKARLLCRSRGAGSATVQEVRR